MKKILLFVLTLLPAYANQQMTINLYDSRIQEIKCSRCHKIITMQDDYQLVAMCNDGFMLYPMCIPCAEEYYKHYDEMLNGLDPDKTEGITNGSYIVE